MAALDHPNIVTVFSVEEADGLHFLTMAYVEGRTLDAHLPPGGLALDRFLELAIPLAEALGAAHESGIVHRDLKPSNVMIDKAGRPRVMDFGLAKVHRDAASPAASGVTEALTAAGTVLGTPLYMSPEQLRGQPVDARSDLFSLGVVFYEMATGRRPFQGEDQAALTASILRDAPRPITDVHPQLPEQLGRMVNRLLVALDEVERAFDYLERGFTDRSFGMTFLGVEPDFDPLRSDPRFGDLLRRLGLPRGSLSP